MREETSVHDLHMWGGYSYAYDPVEADIMKQVLTSYTYEVDIQGCM
jgi:hypothetical protein